MSLLTLYPSQTQISVIFTVHQIWMEGEANLKQTQPNLYKNMLRFKELHDGDYFLWSSEMIEDLIRNRYPDLLSIYNEYPHDIMRINLAKYIILYHYGGFYIDIECKPRKCLYSLVHDYDKVLLAKGTDIYKTVKSDNKKFISPHFLYVPFLYHPFIKLVLNEAPKKAKRKPFEPHLTHFLRGIGMYFLTHCVKKYKKMKEKEMIQHEKEEDLNELKLLNDENDRRRLSISRGLSRSLSYISWKLHTSDVIDLVNAWKLDFYFQHNGLCNIEESWIKELKYHNKIVLSSGQIILATVCVGVLIAVLV